MVICFDCNTPMKVVRRDKILDGLVPRVLLHLRCPLCKHTVYIEVDEERDYD